MAGPTRLELATSCVTGRRSNQLNYDPENERAGWKVRRAEPKLAPATARCQSPISRYCNVLSGCQERGYTPGRSPASEPSGTNAPASTCATADATWVDAPSEIRIGVPSGTQSSTIQPVRTTSVG